MSKNSAGKNLAAASQDSGVQVARPRMISLARRALRHSAALALVVVLTAGVTSLRANELSQQIIAEAQELLRASPPRLPEALLKLQLATAADPDDARAWFLRGGVALTLSQPKAALESFDRAVKLAPDTANLQFLRGRALYELNRHREALAAFDKEKNRDNNSGFWFARAMAAKGARNYAEALSSLDKADAANERGRAATQLQRAEIYTAQRKSAEAIKAYETATSLDPGSPVAVTAEDRLRILRQPVPVRPATRRDGVVRPVDVRDVARPEAPPPVNPFSLRAFVGVESDNNVARLDSGIPFPPQLQTKGDLRMVAEARAVYYLMQQAEHYLGVIGDVRGSFHRRDTAYDDAIYGGAIFGARTFGAWRIGGEIRFDHSSVDQQGYSDTTSGMLWTSYRWNQQHETIVTYRGRYTDYLDAPSNAFLDRSGRVYFVALSHLWTPWSAGNEFLTIEPGIRFARERTHGGYFDNDEQAAFVAVRYQKVVFGPRPTLFETGLFYYDQNYVDVAAQLAVNVASGRVRKDDNFSQWVRVVHPLNDVLGLEMSYRNGSNYTNVYSFGYQNQVWRLGLVGWF